MIVAANLNHVARFRYPKVALISKDTPNSPTQLSKRTSINKLGNKPRVYCALLFSSL